MNVDTIARNVAAYVGFFGLAVLVGGLTSVHVQYQAHGYVDPMVTLDAVIAYVLPSLVLMLGAMKLPSVGGERPASRVQDVREHLQVETPTERRLQHAGAVEPQPVRASRASVGGTLSSGPAGGAPHPPAHPPEHADVP